MQTQVVINMCIASSRRGWLMILLLFLSACASEPIKFKNVAPPASLPIIKVTSARPLLALVLGSGGGRGFAHIGVIKVLEENGIPIDIVVGTSAGSVVGALHAGGYHAEELEQLALKLNQKQLDDYELSINGYIRGERLQDFINQALQNRSIEQLDKPFAAVSTELTSGKEVVFNHGNTGMAVRASSSIPGVFHPVMINGLEYVDGALKDPVPVDVAHLMGADIVIAVDVTQQPQNNPETTNVLETLKQSIRIMQQSIIDNEITAAQIVIHPNIGVTPDINTVSKLQLIQAGAEAARAALPAIREWQKKIAKSKSQEGSTTNGSRRFAQ